jgi:hypothetical protein
MTVALMSRAGRASDVVSSSGVSLAALSDSGKRPASNRWMP